MVDVTAICAWRMTSSRPMTDTSAVSFIRIMNRLPSPGSAMRHICGITSLKKIRERDMPSASPFMLHIHAAVAEEEAQAISQRTKAALAAAKARGVKLGGDRGYRPSTPPDWTLGTKAAGEARSRAADHAAHALSGAIADIRAALGAGASLQAIARGLTERGVTTPRGGAWTATAVRRALGRVEGVV